MNRVLKSNIHVLYVIVSKMDYSGVPKGARMEVKMKLGNCRKH
jgi:hypothetical protein